MHNAPYPDESLNTQPTEPVIEDLPPKPVSQTPFVNEAVPSVAVEGEGSGAVEIHQKEARTVVFAIGKVNDFLQWFSIVLEIILLLRFIFKLIGANQTNAFASFLYALTDIVLAPFNNIVGTGSIHQTQAFEWSTLIGMAVYGLIFFAIRRFLRILISSPEPVE